MKKGGIFVLFLFLSIFGSKFSFAAKEISVGVAVISPTGLSAKFWLSKEHAIDVFGSWSFNSDKFNFHANYLLHDFNKIKIDENPMAFYYGVGIRVKNEANKDAILGIRMPFGVSYLISGVPFDIFGEVAPRVNIVPSTNFGLDVMIGIRYRFFAQDHSKTFAPTSSESQEILYPIE